MDCQEQSILSLGYSDPEMASFEASYGKYCDLNTFFRKKLLKIY